MCVKLYCSTYGNTHARKLCTCLTAASIPPVCVDERLLTEAKTSGKYHHLQVKFYVLRGPATTMRSHRNRKCSLTGKNRKGNCGKMHVNPEDACSNPALVVVNFSFFIQNLYYYWAINNHYPTQQKMVHKNIYYWVRFGMRTSWHPVEYELIEVRVSKSTSW